MLIALALNGVSILSLGCSSGSAQIPAEQLATVQRGNLNADITSVGNLALSDKVDLPFEMDGTVQEVLVTEAQSVSANQTLARLDTTAWEQQVTTLEDAVTAAERNVTAKQRAVTAAQRNVTDAEQSVTQAERGITQAEQTVTSKGYALLQAQINLNNAQLSLEQTEETSTDPLAIQVKQLQVELAQGNLDSAQQALDDALSTSVADAQQAVEDAKVHVEDMQVAVDDAEQAVKDTQKALGDAQQALTDAQAASPEIKAPFDGFITSVNVAGGDEIKKGTVAMTIADPTKFDAEVMVSEVDILKVQVGGAASVQVEAMPGVTFPATVTQKAPSGTIQSGVVTYKVRVDLTSLQPVAASVQSGTAATGNVTAGTPSARSGQGFAGSSRATGNATSPSSRFGQGFASGNLTQEQISQLMQQRQQLLAGQTGGQTSPAAGASTGDAQLAEGMTVTVNIVTAQRNNVLLVPVQAIISQNGQTTVQALNNGVTEEREVQVGISNWQYAEITSGLSEGEQVVIPETAAPATTTGSTTTRTQQSSSGGAVPGLGRILR
ncbi:MAG: HlyD family efflux transporter periplasmic adaptor subunit [Chloroflexota bacterium]